MRKVLVIGPGGAGKTTLALRLARHTGLPLVHLDRLYWRPGWVATPPEEWERTVAELVRQPCWIMDGNYGGTLECRLSAADSVVFLDTPRVVCVWRLLKRRLRHLRRARPPVAPGCPERLTAEFLWWVWTYPSRRRRDVLARLEEIRAEKPVAILRSAAEVERFMVDFAHSRAD